MGSGGLGHVTITASGVPSCLSRRREGTRSRRQCRCATPARCRSSRTTPCSPSRRGSFTSTAGWPDVLARLGDDGGRASPDLAPEVRASRGGVPYGLPLRAACVYRHGVKRRDQPRLPSRKSRCRRPTTSRGTIEIYTRISGARRMIWQVTFWGCGTTSLCPGEPERPSAQACSRRNQQQSQERSHDRLTHLSSSSRGFSRSIFISRESGNGTSGPHTLENSEVTTGWIRATDLLKR